jgi:uncharacterized protein (UPF0303 family)
MNLDQDLERLKLQEEQLQFSSFDAQTAWNVGVRLREAAEKRQWAVAIDIEVNRHLLFLTAMPGTTPDNLDWIRRKKNVVNRFQRSSYAIGLELKRDKTTLLEKIAVEDRDYAPHGGCFPIRVRGTGCIGTITVSGLPQRIDHELIIEVLAEMLDQPIKDLALAT